MKVHEKGRLGTELTVLFSPDSAQPDQADIFSHNPDFFPVLSFKDDWRVIAVC